MRFWCNFASWCIKVPENERMLRIRAFRRHRTIVFSRRSSRKIENSLEKLRKKLKKVENSVALSTFLKWFRPFASSQFSENDLHSKDVFRKNTEQGKGLQKEKKKISNETAGGAPNSIYHFLCRF